MKVKYQNPHFNPKKLSEHNIDRMALAEITVGSFVLDVGCATGFMGKYLREKQKCKVFGVDLRSAELAIARKNLDQVIQGDIQDLETIKKILKKTNNKKFDVVLATSLIEHTTNPKIVIQQIKKILKPNGLIIMSTPNIAHWSMRLSLLFGKFNYTEYGILDRTHVHFFTLETFQELFRNSGLHIHTVKIDAEGGGYPRVSLLLAPFFPNLFAYQILIVAENNENLL